MPAGQGYGLLSSPLLSGSLGLLAAGGPSPYPTSVGQGLLSGLGQAQQSMSQNLQRQQAEAQMQAQQQRSQLIQAQLQAQQQQAQREQAMMEAVRSNPGLLGLQPGDPRTQALGLLEPQGIQQLAMAQFAAPDAGGPLAQKVADFTAAMGRPPRPDELQRMAGAADRGALVNIKSEGAIPQGMRAVRDQSGNIIRLEPIPGGVQPTGAERERGATQDLSIRMLNDFGQVIQAGGIETGPVAGRIIRGKAKTGIGELTQHEAAALSLEESISNQLLAAVRGAQVGPAEQERFERQLPRLDQPPSLFQENLRRTRENVQFLRTREAQMRNEAPQPALGGAPPASTGATIIPAPEGALDGERVIGNRRFIKRDGQWFEVTE